MSIAGYAGWPAYDTFLIVLLSGRPVYDPNSLRPNPNPEKLVSGSCRVRRLGRTLTPLLLMVAIDRVSTMQLFCRGSISCGLWHYSRLCFPQTTPTDDTKKSTMSYMANTRSQQHLHNTKKRGPNREHWCGAGRIPSKDQVRTSHNSRVLERGKLCIPWLVRVLGLL